MKIETLVIALRELDRSRAAIALARRMTLRHLEDLVGLGSAGHSDSLTTFRAEFGAEGEAAVRSILQNPGGDRDEVMDLYARMAHAGKGGGL